MSEEIHELRPLYIRAILLAIGGQDEIIRKASAKRDLLVTELAAISPRHVPPKQPFAPPRAWSAAGGHARAAALTPAERHTQASAAAKARWAKYRAKRVEAAGRAQPTT